MKYYMTTKTNGTLHIFDDAPENLIRVTTLLRPKCWEVTEHTIATDEECQLQLGAFNYIDKLSILLWP